MIKDKHITHYGRVNLLRMYCEGCKSMTIVLDNEKQCCDEPIQNDLSDKLEIMVHGKQPKKQPTKHEKINLLKIQNNKCFYCEAEFGSIAIKDGHELLIKIHYDHVIPYVYTQGLNQEFVASCQHCNAIKSSKMFDSLKELKEYVNNRRAKKRIKNLP